MTTKTIDFATAVWHKAVASDNQGECVEVATAGGHIGVRDSKNRGRAVLVFPAVTFERFTAGVRAGDFG